MAIYALKIRLSFPISLIGISTRGTRAAGISRVNEIYRNAIQFALVFNKRPQFKETPTAMPCFLRLAKPFLCSLSDTAQIFERKRTVLCLSLIYKVFCYAVVFKFAEILFTSAKPFQQFVNRAGTFARLRLFACLMLQNLSLLRVFLPNSFHFRACKSLACGVSRQTNNSKINTDDVIRNKRRIFENIANAVQKELTFAVNQINFAFAMLKQFSLVIAHYKRDVQSTFNSPDRNNIVLFEGNNAVIVSDRTQRFESSLFFVLDFVGIRNFSDLSDNHLTRKIKHLSGWFIDNFVQVKLTEGFILKRLLGNPITRLVCFFQSFKQSSMLNFQRFEFDIYNQFHTFKYRTKGAHNQAWIDSNALLPTQFPKRNMGRVSALFF